MYGNSEAQECGRTYTLQMTLRDVLRKMNG